MKPDVDGEGDVDVGLGAAVVVDLVTLAWDSWLSWVTSMQKQEKNESRSPTFPPPVNSISCSVWRSLLCDADFCDACVTLCVGMSNNCVTVL